MSLLKYTMFFLLFILPANALAKDFVKVAIFDTGMNLNDVRFNNVLCKEGHKNLTSEPWEKAHPHGTHVAGIIKKYAKDAPYCIIVYKIFKTKHSVIGAFLAAMEDAAKQGVKVMNFSGGGENYYEEEYDFLRNHPDMVLFAAAGNEGKNIDHSYDTYYPAYLSKFLSNIKVVGNVTSSGERDVTSNYGTLVKYWEIGMQWSTMPKGQMGWMNGTSMSTAAATGRYIYENYH